MYSPERRVGIGHLPTELLLIIFTLVFKSLDPHPKYATRWNPVDIRAPSLFPYALAAVCPTWRDILATVPEFWTQIVIDIGLNPTPLSAVRSYMKWSGKQVVDITVHRLDGSVLQDVLEGARISAVVKTIVPHLYRCHSLRIDVIHACSLPSIRHDFHGPAPRLEKLELCSKNDDGGGCPSDEGDVDLVSPALKTVYLDGRTFRGLCRDGSSWLATVESLSISNLKAQSSSEEALSLRLMILALRQFPRLLSLSINNVDFQMSDPLDDLPDGMSNVSTLRLENIHPNALAQLLAVNDFATMEQLVIKRCSIAELDPKRMPYSYFLTLQGIPDEKCFGPLLSYWSGIELHVDDCPGFNNEVLEELSRGGDNDNDWICPHLNKLSVSGCRISKSYLCATLQAREAAYRIYVPDGLEPPLSGLFLKICPIREFSMVQCGVECVEEDWSGMV